MEADFDCMMLLAFFRLVEYLEMSAGALSYLTRMISTGKLDFPPPPEPVLLCQVHTETALCSCLRAINVV